MLSLLQENIPIAMAGSSLRARCSVQRRWVPGETADCANEFQLSFQMPLTTRPERSRHAPATGPSGLKRRTGRARSGCTCVVAHLRICADQNQPRLGADAAPAELRVSTQSRNVAGGMGHSRNACRSRVVHLGPAGYRVRARCIARMSTSAAAKHAHSGFPSGSRRSAPRPSAAPTRPVRSVTCRSSTRSSRAGSSTRSCRRVASSASA